MQLKNSYESYVLLWNHWVKVVLNKIMPKINIKYKRLIKTKLKFSHLRVPTCKATRELKILNKEKESELMGENVEKSLFRLR